MVHGNLQVHQSWEVHTLPVGRKGPFQEGRTVHREWLPIEGGPFQGHHMDMLEVLAVGMEAPVQRQ